MGLEGQKTGYDDAEAYDRYLKEKNESESRETDRLGKVRESFLNLIKNRNFSINGILGDSKTLADKLELGENYTQKDFESSMEVINDVLRNDALDHDRRLAIKSFLVDSEDVGNLKAQAKETEDKKDEQVELINGEISEESVAEKTDEDKIDVTLTEDRSEEEKEGEAPKTDEIPFTEEGAIPPEHSLAHQLYKEGVLMRLEDGTVVEIKDNEPQVAPKERILIADVSEVVKAMAWRVAENRLNEIVHPNSPTPQRGFGRIRGFFRSMIGTIGERGYLNKYFYEALSTMRDDQDLLADIQARLAGQSEVVSSDPARVEQWQILDTVVREMQEGVMEACERGEDLENSGIIFADLINRHLMGEFPDRAAFEAAARESIEQAINAGDISRDQFSTEGRGDDAEGIMYASNLYEVAETQRARIEARFADGEWAGLSPEQRLDTLEHITGMGSLDISLATKQRDYNDERAERPDRTRGYLRAMDRVANFARRHPILGAVVNPTTLGFMGSLAVRAPARSAMKYAAGIGLGATGFAIGGFAIPLLVGAGMGGVFSYARRHRNLAYDRGLESRRETTNLRGEGRRAEVIRGFGFSGISRDAEELLAGVNAGDAGITLEAAALFQAERDLLEAGRPVDLITVQREVGEQYRTNYIQKTELKIALRDRMPDPDAVEARVTQIIANINAQDREFESFRGKESWKAMGYGALTGATFGLIASEVADYAAERLADHDLGTTLTEYIRGDRGELPHFREGNLDITPMEVITRQVVMPETGEPVDVSYRLGYDGNWIPVHTGLPEGYTFDDAGNLVHDVAGIEGGAVTETSWQSISEMWATQGEGLLDKAHVSWVDFGNNENPSVGDSYTDFYIPRSEGTELQMDFVQQSDGSVAIDASRMLGHAAFSHGQEVQVNQEMLDQLVVTISPRDEIMQHEALVGHITDGKLILPPDIAKEVMQVVDGHVEPKPGIMITLDQYLRTNSEGHQSLFSIAAQYNEGPIPGTGGGGEPFVTETFPPIHEVYPAPQPPTLIEGQGGDPFMFASPYDPRRPIGNPGPENKSNESNENQDPRAEKVAVKKGEKVKVVDDKDPRVLWMIKKAQEKANEASRQAIQREEASKIHATRETINTMNDGGSMVAEKPQEVSPKQETASAIPLGPSPDLEAIKPIVEAAPPKQVNIPPASEAVKEEPISEDDLDRFKSDIASKVPPREKRGLVRKVSIIAGQKSFEDSKDRLLSEMEKDRNMRILFSRIPIRQEEGIKFVDTRDFKAENGEDFKDYLEGICDKLLHPEEPRTRHGILGPAHEGLVNSEPSQGQPAQKESLLKRLLKFGRKE